MVVGASTLMKCPSCGKDIPEDANYCPYCGTRLKEKTGGELVHEELAELRHNELIAIVFSIVFMGLAILFAYIANLPVVETEWTCAITFYGSCIWYVPQFKVKQPYKEDWLISMICFALSLVCIGISAYYSYKRHKIMSDLKRAQPYNNIGRTG